MDSAQSSPTKTGVAFSQDPDPHGVGLGLADLGESYYVTQNPLAKEKDPRPKSDNPDLLLLNSTTSSQTARSSDNRKYEGL